MPIACDPTAWRPARRGTSSRVVRKALPSAPPVRLHKRFQVVLAGPIGFRFESCLRTFRQLPHVAFRSPSLPAGCSRVASCLLRKTGRKTAQRKVFEKPRPKYFQWGSAPSPWTIINQQMAPARGGNAKIQSQSGIFGTRRLPTNATGTCGSPYHDADRSLRRRRRAAALAPRFRWYLASCSTGPGPSMHVRPAVMAHAHGCTPTSNDPRK